VTVFFDPLKHTRNEGRLQVSGLQPGASITGVPSASDMCIVDEEDGHCNDIDDVKESFLREMKESCKFLDCSPGHQYLEFHLHVMCPEE
jgi:hypothetical protein